VMFESDADAVVAHPDLDCLAEIARRHFQYRAEAIASLAAALRAA